MLAIIDYQAGNLTSVKRALCHENIDCIITADEKDLQSADGIIFPGVGAAASAMRYLRQSGLDTVIKGLVASARPMLGICLGCQIILETSQENNGTDTLGIVEGHCLQFDAAWRDAAGQPITIPHMGWNTVTRRTDCALFTDIAPDAQFYFVHSFFPAPAPQYVIATSTHGREFCSVLGRNGFWAVQFHPEKSGEPGLKLLKNFSAYCQENKHAQ